MQLTKVRKRKKLTQDKLAKKCNVSRSLIALVEGGFIKPYPSLRTRIAEALGETEETIFKKRGSKKAS